MDNALFEVNRRQFFKIFETHQFKGLASFTDVLKICSSLKLFPDLIDSQEIQKIFSSVSSGSFHKLTYSEFEEFLKIIAVRIFKKAEEPNYAERFMMHVQGFALKSYGAEIKAGVRNHRSLSKSVKSKKQLSLSSIKNRSAIKVPETTKNAGSKRNLFDINPGMLKLKRKKISEALTQRKRECFTSSVRENDKISQVRMMIQGMRDGMRRVGGNLHLQERKLSTCNKLAESFKRKQVLVRLYFQLWAWS